MDGAHDGLPGTIDALKAALIIERAKALEAAAELAIARAKASQDMALIAHQKLRIARLEHQLYGQRSERSVRLIDQLALVSMSCERKPRKTNWPRRPPSPERPRSRGSRASVLSETHSLSICRANAWCSIPRRHVIAAAEAACANSART